MKLTPEDLQKLQTKQLANVIRKLGDGKTLTGREQALLSAGSVEEAAPVATFVQSWEALATAIPINSKTLENFRKDHAELIEQNKKSLFRSDERKCVPEWRKLIAECGVKGRGANKVDATSEDVRALELAERRLKFRKAEHAFEEEIKATIPVADFEAALGPTFVQFRSSLNALPGRGAGKILSRARTAVVNMLREQLTAKQFEAVDRAMSDAKTSSVEYFDIEQTLQAEVDLVLRTLEQCDYLQVADED